MSAAAATPILEVDSVSVNFGGTRALVDASIAVPEGQIYAIVGPNGSGKSTLLNVISRLVRPAHGNVVFSGVELLKRKSHHLAGHGITRVFQTPVTFPGTVLENILVGMQPILKGSVWRDTLRLPGQQRTAAGALRAATEAAGRVGLSGRDLNRPVSLLNFGEQRRMELARALAPAPTLVLLDEPAAGFNATEVARFGELIKSLQGGGLTIVLVEHNVRFVRDIADSVTVFDHGSVIATGGPDVFGDERVLSVYVGRRHKTIFGTEGQSDA